jgi:hypothetical protein
MTELDPSGKLEFAFEDYDLDEDIKKHTLYAAQIQMGIKTPEMVAEEEGIDIGKLQESKEKVLAEKVDELQQTSPDVISPQKQETYSNEEKKKPETKAIKPENELIKYLDDVKKHIIDKIDLDDNRPIV